MLFLFEPSLHNNGVCTRFNNKLTRQSVITLACTLNLLIIILKDTHRYHPSDLVDMSNAITIDLRRNFEMNLIL